MVIVQNEKSRRLNISCVILLFTNLQPSLINVGQYDYRVSSNVGSIFSRGSIPGVGVYTYFFPPTRAYHRRSCRGQLFASIMRGTAFDDQKVIT